MKNRILSMGMFLLFAGTTIFTGCSKDEEEAKAAPSVTIAGAAGVSGSEGGNFNQNALVSLSYSVTTGENLSKIVITEITGTTTVIKETKTSGFTSSTSHTGTFAYTVPSTAVTGSKITIKIEATDAKSSTSSDSYVITVGSATSNINSYTAKILGGQTNAAGSCLATSTGAVLKLSEGASTPALVDVIYYYGATNKATLAAPSDAQLQTVYSSVANWSTKNATTFSTSAISSADFASATEAMITAENPSATSVTQLAVGNVISFKTAANKKGILKVVAISAATEAGAITVDVKVQK